MRNSLLAFTAAALALSACADKKPDVDAELARDLALVSQAPANPQFQDAPLSAAPETKRVDRTPTQPARTKAATTPVRRAPVVEARRPTTPAPRVEEPAPEPAPAPTPAPRTRGIAAGTSFGLTTNGQVCTTNKFVATLTSPVLGDGTTIPAGTTVVLEVASVTPGDSPETAQISVRVRSILVNDQPYGMEGDVAVLSELERRQIPRDGSSDKKKVIGGAIAGAVLGQIMGRDTKSTVIGAAAGAAAGTAAAAASRKYDACLPSGSTLRVTTSQPIALTD
jgi:hypothetical protein